LILTINRSQPAAASGRTARCKLLASRYAWHFDSKPAELCMEHTHYSGGCVCGSIRYEALGPAENAHTCSCKTCQRHTGSPTVVWVEFAQERVKWVGAGGAPSVFRTSDYSSRAFCPTCGSSIGAIDDEPTIALLIGGFDDTNGAELAPLYHSFEDIRPRWWCLTPLTP
jgi:hypothetical protein